MKFFLLIASFFISTCLLAQHTISGKVVDSSQQPMAAATVQLNRATGNIQVAETLTDSLGKYNFLNVDTGKYVVTVSFVGYGTSSIIATVKADTTNPNGITSVENIQLAKATGTLTDVTVTTNTPGVTQKNDTIQYNASQYKVNPDATSEDLVKKMPGVAVASDGTVTAQGDQVKKVLVDGKEYFGDDATTTLRNLPAEIIDKIQVFDKLSDQAQFTGFDDGNSQRTINIVTKGGMRSSQFGKVYAGYGTDGRYSAGGNVNFFNGDRRIALIGLTNNINQQNFSQQDLLGVLSGGNSGRGGGGGFRGRGGGSSNNFQIGTSNGINATNSIGINYSDTWAKKVTVSGSYFFNNTKNTTQQLTNREYYSAGDSNVYYKEDENANNNNYNHRVNMRIQYKIDSSNQLIFAPTLSFQNNNSNSSTSSLNYLEDGKTLTNILNNSQTSSSGYNFSANLVYRHAFHKRGRSITLGVTPTLSDNTGETYQDIFNNQTGVDSINLFRDKNSHVKGISGMFAYSEPVGKHAQIQFEYQPSWQYSTSKQLRYNYNSDAEKYNLLDTSLSNLFNNTLVKHNTGLNYRIGDRYNNFMIGLNYQYTDMTSDQTYPQALTIHKTFNNVLPNVMFNKKLSDRARLRVFYRASTQTPSVTQLQNVYNDANVLFVTTGNPDLKQAYVNTLATRYTYTNSGKGSSFFINAFLTQNNHYITNATYTASEDSALTKTLVLKQGSQLSKPVNLNGYYSLRTNVTYSFPVKAIKTNLNLSPGFNYVKQPGLVNGIENKSDNYAYSFGLVIASNISEYVDFTIGYTPTYTVVKNTLQPNQNNNYYSGSATASINLLSKSGWVIHTDVSNTGYSGLSGGYNQNYTLWNASAGKKFLKNQRGDLRFSIFDILKQNQSISRQVTETYLEDVQTNVLQRYFMLTFTYKINNVRSNSSKNGDEDLERERNVPRAPFDRSGPPPDGGGPPPGGMGGGPM